MDTALEVAGGLCLVAAALLAAGLAAGLFVAGVVMLVFGYLLEDEKG